MRITQVSIRPSEQSINSGRPELTPELLAATGARYSRNNQGLSEIIAKIDPENLDRSVDSIFKMIDYGHQSIADMAPVAIFMDDISLWLANFIWTLCPTAGGQESSTRYLKYTEESLIDPELLGIPHELVTQWKDLMVQHFSLYDEVLSFWSELAKQNPEVLRIPDQVMGDDSASGKRKFQRMKRNYAYDRSRYLIPIATATNMMLVMSARGWVNLCQHLLSSAVPEAVKLGELLKREMGLATPRLLKHAVKTASVAAGYRRLHQMQKKQCADIIPESLIAESDFYEHDSDPFCVLTMPPGISEEDLVESLELHDNRYAWTGPASWRSVVRFGWGGITFGELRDLNRHRTGSKFFSAVPQGFYCAQDQLPVPIDRHQEIPSVIRRASKLGKIAAMKSGKHLRDGAHHYMFWANLGTQYPFEHTTSFSNYVYEAELRTDTGAHFRYAKHLKDTIDLLEERHPLLKGCIRTGTYEPE